jgi:hypothetical protein
MMRLVPATFELETPSRIRKLDFDPDAFQQADVRVLVDGQTVATMPFPNELGPHQEAALEVDGRSFTAVAQLAAESGPVDAMGLRFDLFAGGFSLVDGSTLETARLRALNPVGRYPGIFRFIDAVLRIAPAAAIPGILLGINGRETDVSNEPETTIALLAALIGAMLVGTLIASRVWTWIRGRTNLSVLRRAALGAAGVLGSYAATWTVAIALLAGLTNAGFINQSVCADAGRAATEKGGVGLPTGGPLLLSDPGSDFTLVFEAPMNLEQAAASRVDSLTLNQLREFGFEDAYARQWIRSTGTMLGSDVFTFDNADGAASFHQAVTAYACRYSTEQFAIPGGAVGLRILYGSGDPVRDQAAWIDGNRRVVIALGYQDDSADHSEILDLVRQARGVR